MKHIWIAAAALALLCGVAEAKAATTGVPTLVNVLPTPPAGFDPFEASATERAQYGIPPAPNASGAPDAFQAWRRAMSFPTRRDTSPTLTIGRRAGINIPVGVPTPMYNSKHGVASSSTGWSGVSMVDNTNPFAMEEVEGVFTVPTGQASSSCQLLNISSLAKSTYSTHWVGIDGNGSSDVLQAGIQIETTCLSGTATTSYQPWVEWYPNLEIMLSSPTVSPGDLIEINVWATSPTAGYAFIENLSTGVSASYAITAPTGVRLVGDSIEWVIEDPTLSNGAQAAFTNYVGSAWPLAAAWNYQSSTPAYYYAGQLPTQGTLQLITLVNSKSQPLSVATIENTESLFFQSYTSTCGPQQNWPC